MTWQELLMILVPSLSALAWVYNRIDKKFDKIDKTFEKIDQRLDTIDKKFEAVLMEIKEIRRDIQSIDVRMSLLEGRFDERGYWESRIYKNILEKEG